MCNQKYIVVIGAVNIDIIGIPNSYKTYVAGDSNPGTILTVPGGVGRNIAANIAKLSYPTKLITVFGSDTFTNILKKDLLLRNIDIRYSLTLCDANTSAYVCVNDENGDALAAVSDMAIYQSLKPETMRHRLSVLENADMVIIDANIPAETIEFITSSVHVPIFCDPVSVNKASRLIPSLSHVFMIKPNIAETEVLLKRKIADTGDVQCAAAELLSMGVKHIFISLGSKGVYFLNHSVRGMLPCYPGIIKNTNGCGDAFIAAAAIGYAMGYDISMQAKMGLAASCICAESGLSVPDMMSIQNILNKVGDENVDKSISICCG